MKNITGNDSSDRFSTSKYLIKINYTIKGLVSVMDIIGALFGQTEGLLNDLELRELQKSGRIGRIQVENSSDHGISSGNILIPSSLDRVETAILAATIESVDRVGPCSAKMQLAEIKDIREDKRKRIMDRAQELLKKWEIDTPESAEIGEKILTKMRTGVLIEYGPEKLPAGEDIETSQQIIIVEGVADVKALMRAGFRNAIATKGTHVPKSVIELSKKKSCIAFMDGDRGGQIILNELLQVADIDYIAMAPKGIMVEELTRKQIIKYLQSKKTLQEYNSDIGSDKKYNSDTKVHRNRGFRTFGKKKDTRKYSNNYKGRKDPQQRYSPKIKQSRYQPKPIEKDLDPKIFEYMKTITATNEALGLNEKNEQVFRVGNTKVFKTLDSAENVKTLVLDGIITKKLLDKVLKKKITEIYAINQIKNLKVPSNIKIKLFKNYMQ
jgi:DNA primase